MKILILSHKFSPDIGGIESISEMLADEFTKYEHEVHILTWSKKEDNKKHPFLVIRNPSVVEIIKEINWCNIIFENNPCLRMSWPNLFARRPIVISLQTWLNRTDGTTSLHDKIKTRWLKKANRVVACSEAVREQIFPDANIIHNAYNEKTFKRLPEIPKKKDFVFLGRLVSDKGADIAINAFSILLEKYNNSTLNIIGDGPDRERLYNQAKELGILDKVIFQGSLKGKELNLALNEYRYLLVPSIWKEPFGIVALEGMACGCIPVVADGGGLPNAIGNAGLIFERGNVKSLLDCMLRIKNDSHLEDLLRAASKEHLLNHQSKAVAKRYLAIFDSILN